MSREQRGHRLIVMLKAPRPGFVKTRLAAALGAEEACRVYRELVETLLRNLSRLDSVELRFSPDNAAPDIVPWQEAGWKLTAQGPGDLGERMRRAFLEAFGQGVQRVVVIGSDCPEVTVEDIRSAWEALGTADVVLGPALDGGYWLIGLTRDQPALFEGIEWGGAEVLQSTLVRAERGSLHIHRLRSLADVDTVGDWTRFRANQVRTD